MATIAGLVLNCANSALYMANYNLVVRRRSAADMLCSLHLQSVPYAPAGHNLTSHPRRCVDPGVGSFTAAARFPVMV